jgi:cation transport ATPase
VIATPCPLILAVPVAIVSGMSQAAKSGVLIKGGRPSRLSPACTPWSSKTGTVALGAARLVATHLAGSVGQDEILRIAALVDQASAHVIAGAVAAEARQRAIGLTSPSEVIDAPGQGVEGVVDGRRVAGGPEFRSAGACTPMPPGWGRGCLRARSL